MSVAPILEGDTGELDALVRDFIARSVSRLIERLRDNYEDWAMDQIAEAATDYVNIETGEVNARAVVQAALPLMPRPNDEEMQDLYSIIDGDELIDVLREFVLDGMDEGYHLRMLQAEISRIIPAVACLTRHWQCLALSVGSSIAHGCARFLIAMCNRWLRPAGKNSGRRWQKISEAAQRDFITASKTKSAAEAQASFYGALGSAQGRAFRQLLEELEEEELIDALQARVDELLNAARHDPDEAKKRNGDLSQPEAIIYAIGAEQLTEYERALMLSVIDGEWRQYLVAIDDLRQGIGLEAYGQRDPKVEFKRRAFEMFDKLREDVEEGISRRFFNELPRHRQIVEQQQRQEELLDQLAAQGYRVEQKVTKSKKRGGQRKVSQTVRSDMWANVGRNDMCPCGSGKKFKDCHYKEVRQGQRTVDQDQIRKSSSRRRRRR